MTTVDDSVASRYEEDGFAIVGDLLTAADVESLRRRISDIASGRVPGFPAENVEFEPEGAEACMPTARKINQCAENDGVFMALADDDRILDVVESLIGPDIRLYGSQCFMKPAGGVEKPYHQDSAYFTIEPRSLVTCWLALDNVTVDNGCLCVIPGSHRGELHDHSQPWQVGERVDMQLGGIACCGKNQMHRLGLASKARFLPWPTESLGDGGRDFRSSIGKTTDGPFGSDLAGDGNVINSRIQEV